MFKNFRKSKKAAFPSFPVLVGNTHHIGKRESQQDSFAISDISDLGLTVHKGIFGVVADGMGGMADGAEAGSIVSGTMLKYWSEAEYILQPETDLLKMLVLANDNVNSFMSGRGKGGSTAVATILIGGMLYWIAVGDSRIYLVRNGAPVQLNREHVYSAELDEMAAMGEISWEHAFDSSKRDNLTACLGMGKPEKIDRNINPVQLLPGDRVLLMSDGVFGTLNDYEIMETMPFDPHVSSVKLQEKILEKADPNQDNFTAIIFEYWGIQS